MPTFKPLGTKVQLVAFDLAASTTSNPGRSKPVASQDTKRAEQLVLHGQPLLEEHLPCLGDDTRLHFLDDVPFYLVSLGSDHFESKVPTLAERVNALIKKREHDRANGKAQNITLQSSRDDSVVDTQQDQVPAVDDQNAGNAPQQRTPQALGIVITLPTEGFVRPFLRDGKKDSNSDRARLDIKWDVFVNGELCITDFQSARYAGGKDGVKHPCLDNGNIRIVSGKRVDVLHERPLVLQTASIGIHPNVQHVETSAQAAAARWKEIGQALLQEADELGYNKLEERRPLGKYLADLAEMEMPASAIDMQKAEGRKFGVIDVVFTAGKGDKANGHFLVAPEQLVDSSYKRMPDDWQPSSICKKQAAELERATQLAAQQAALTAFAPTAASGREKRDIESPISYRDAAPRKSRTVSPERPNRSSQSPAKRGDRSPEKPSSASPEKRARILPPFPSIPQLDFNDVIAITPTKAEEIRQGRGARDTSPTVDAVERSSPVKNMPPPMIIPRSASHGKRRRSDTISMSSPSSSPTRPPVNSTRPGANAGSKSVSGYMGMTRRGIFSNRPNAQISAPDLQTSSPGPAVTGSRSLRPLSPIKRVVITDGDSPIVDKTLTSPYKLSNDSPLQPRPSSPHQPLDESVLFRARAMGSPVKRARLSSRAASSPVVPALASTPQPMFAPPSNASISSPRAYPASQSQMSLTPMQPSPLQHQMQSTLPPSPTPAPQATPTPVKPALEVAPRLVKPAPKATPTLVKPATKTPTKPSSKPSSPAATPAFQAKGTPAAQQKAKRQHEDVLTELRATWVMPELSKNCVLTYADEGDWFKDQGSVVRHVKSGRAGTFIENEVLFAVRYIVPA